MLGPTKHFDCLLTDYLYRWHLQIIKKNHKFYVIQSRQGEIKRLLNGGNINTAWSVVLTLLQQPFQSVEVLQHLNVQLNTEKHIKQSRINDIQLVVVGINQDNYTLADMKHTDDLSAATVLKGQFYSAISSLRLFDLVRANLDEMVVIEKL